MTVRLMMRSSEDGNVGKENPTGGWNGSPVGWMERKEFEGSRFFTMHGAFAIAITMKWRVTLDCFLLA